MMKLHRLAIGSAMFLAVVLAWRVDVIREPELLLARDDRVPFAVLPLPDGRFEHRFIHSVHKTLVQEWFKVEAKGDGAVLHLYELRYQSLGVGMPTDAEGGFRREGGTFILSMDRSFQELQIMVSPIGGHGILVGGDFTPFSDHLQPGHRVVLSARMTRHIRLRR